MSSVTICSPSGKAPAAGAQSGFTQFPQIVMGKLLAASPRQSRREGAKRIGKLPKVVSDESYTGIDARAAT